MNHFKVLVAVILVTINFGAFAGYSCPDTTDQSGGWMPAECGQQANFKATISSGYSCPTVDDSRGGWMPAECAQQSQVLCKDCGTIENVNVIETEEASGLGAVAGAVAGGLIGNKVGKGKGKKLTTVIGAVGGAVGGHYGEKLLRKKNRWDVIVLMEDGSHRTISFDIEPGYQVGDKVKVEGKILSKQ